MSDYRGRRGSAWTKIRLFVLDRDAWTCRMPRCLHPAGRAIDTTLPGTAKWGPSVDHVIEVALDGPREDPAFLRAAHRHCNVSAGGALGGRMRPRKPKPGPGPTPARLGSQSRRW
jgi:hypothetical protein